MSKYIREWLLTEKVSVDNIGRIILNDENVLAEINGAVSALASQLVDAGNMGCGAGCDTSCGG